MGRLFLEMGTAAIRKIDFEFFCIDEKEADVPILCAVDEVHTEFQGSVPLEKTPTSTGRTVLLPRQLIDSGNHFDDLD
jgi:hypothetical protein